MLDVQATEGAAQSAIQYFENMRNFLAAVGKMKLLTFGASDLEKVCAFSFCVTALGSSMRIYSMLVHARIDFVLYRVQYNILLSKVVLCDSRFQCTSVNLKIM